MFITFKDEMGQGSGVMKVHHVITAVLHHAACQHAVSSSWKAFHGCQCETKLDNGLFCLDLIGIQTDRQACFDSLAAVSCVGSNTGTV